LGRAAATATKMAMDRRMFHVYNYLARFSNYLASFLASVHLEVFQKKEEKWAFYLCYKYKYANAKIKK
jgi:hypothetical protein